MTIRTGPSAPLSWPPARNDGVGMAGLSPDVQLLAVKVLDSTGTGTDFGVAQGIVWATDRGAQIINLSLGTATDSQVLSDAVAYAQAHNVLLVAAAGNSGSEQMFYPASYPGVMSVGACTNSDERASYSTYNAALSIMAPGGDGSSDPDEQILGASLHGAYSFGSGTSFASPQVAAAAALYLGSHPGTAASTDFCRHHVDRGHGEHRLQDGARRPAGAASSVREADGGHGRARMSLGPPAVPATVLADGGEMSFRGRGRGSLTQTPSTPTPPLSSTCGPL